MPDSSPPPESAFFVARSWLERIVIDWLAAADGSRVLVVSGGPGTGKSRYLHELSRRLSTPEGWAGATLGGAIIRDLAGRRSDDFAWPTLREALLLLTPEPPTLPPHTKIDIRSETIADHARVYGQIIGAQFLGGASPADDLRELVLPRMHHIPAGPPIAVLVDGLDEAVRDRADRFIDVVEELADAVERAPHRDRGAGRLRVLLASQPELPIRTNPQRPPARLDLNAPAASDQEDLERYAAQLLVSLPGEDRGRLAKQIAEKAPGGLWVWVSYAAEEVLAEVAAGNPPPPEVRTPQNLRRAWEDALQRAEGRLPAAARPALVRLLGLIAAANDVGAALPADVARGALGVGAPDLHELAQALAAVVPAGPDGYRFNHGELSRWLADGGYGPVDVSEAHDRLAIVLTEAGARGWAAAGAYASRYALPHALAAAELSLSSVSFTARVERCLALVSDPGLVAGVRVHGGTEGWLTDLRRLADLCPADTRVAGSALLTGLDARLYDHLRRAVGDRISADMTEDQLNEFDGFIDSNDEAAGLAWLQTNRPDYRTVVAEQTVAAWSRVLAGWDPPGEEPAYNAGSLSRSLIGRWRGDPQLHHQDLHHAIAAAERAVRLTAPDHAYRTSRMIDLAEALGERIRAGAERPGDLDRLIEVRSEVISRPDLEVPHATFARYGDWLAERWRRDQGTRAGDLDAAIDAYEQALGQWDDTPDRVELLERCVGLYASRADSEATRPGDQDRLVELCAELTRRPDLPNLGRYWANYGASLLERWRRHPETHADDLPTAIHANERAVSLLPDEDPHLTEVMSIRVNAYIGRATSEQAEPSDLDRIVDLQRELTRRPDVPDPGETWHVYGAWLENRWRRDPATGGDDLDSAIDAYEHAVAARPDGHPLPAEPMRRLVELSLSRFDHDPERGGDLERAIELAATLTSSSEPPDPGDAHAYASGLMRRWQRDPAANAGDRDRAIEALARALELTGDDDSNRDRRLRACASALSSRIGTAAERTGDLDQIVTLRAELVKRGDPPDRTVLAAYADWLGTRWRRDPDAHPTDLDAAIETLERALAATDSTGTDLASIVMSAVNAYIGRLNRGPVRLADLDRALELQAELLTRPELADPAWSWGIQASLLIRRWRHAPDTHADDLDAAIAAAERSLLPAEPAHERRTELLEGCLRRYAERIGTSDERPGDLDRAGRLADELTSRPDLADTGLPHELRGDCWISRWRREPTRTADLDTAIDAYEEALSHTPDDDDRRPSRVLDLAWALIGRADSDRESDGDARRITELVAELSARPSGEDVGLSHEVWGDWCIRLWRHDPTRTADLDTAIDAYEQALAHTPSVHPRRGYRLHDLAVALGKRLPGGTRTGDLDRCLAVMAEYTSRGDVANPGQAYAAYAAALTQRWRRDRHPADQHYALLAWEHALEHTPRTEPARRDRLIGAANALIGRLRPKDSAWGTEPLAQEGDLERLLELQGELVTRSDLANPVSAWLVYATWLRERWRRNAESRAEDLDQALAAANTAVAHLPSAGPDDPDDETVGAHTVLANLHLLAYVNRRPGADLTRAIDLAVDLERRAGGTASGLWAPLRQLARRRIAAQER